MDHSIRKRRKLRVKPHRLQNGQMLWWCFVDGPASARLRMERPGIGVTPRVALQSWSYLNPRVQL